MSQKRWNKFDKKEVIIAYQTQLNQSNVELHGSRHLKAAIEQHASRVSSAVPNPHDAVKWESDPNHKPEAPAKTEHLAKMARRRRGREAKQMERLKQLLQIPGKTEQLLKVNGTKVRNELILQQAIATIKLLQMRTSMLQMAPRMDLQDYNLSL